MKFALARLGAQVAFEQLPDPLLLVDPDGKALKLNIAALALLCPGCRLPPGGRPLAELGSLGAQLAGILQGVAIDDERGVATDTPAGSAPVLGTDSALYELRASAVRTPEGELLVRIVRLADVTAARRDADRLEQSRAQLAAQVQAQTEELHQLAARLQEERRALALAQERLLAIEDVAGIGHLDWDARRGLVASSPRVVSDFGVAAESRTDVDVAMDIRRVAAEDRERIQERLQRIMRGEAVPTVRFSVEVPGEDMPRRFVAPPPAYEYTDGRVVRAIGLLQDITATERAARRFERLNQELEAEVEARTRDLSGIARQLEGFAYMATHDLRAPLRAINGHAAIVQEEHAGVLGAESRASLAEIVQLANRLDELIDDLRVLAVDASATATSQRIDLAPLAQRLVRDWQRGAGAAGAPRLVTPETLWMELDPVRGPLLWRYLLRALCERCARLAPGGELRIAPTEEGNGVLVRGAIAAQQPLDEPLVAYLLERMGMRLAPNGAGELCVLGDTGGAPP